jgi:hypothetical protein
MIYQEKNSLKRTSDDAIDKTKDERTEDPKKEGVTQLYL